MMRPHYFETPRDPQPIQPSITHHLVPQIRLTPQIVVHSAPRPVVSRETRLQSFGANPQFTQELGGRHHRIRPGGHIEHSFVNNLHAFRCEHRFDQPHIHPSFIDGLEELRLHKPLPDNIAHLIGIGHGDKNETARNAHQLAEQRRGVLHIPQRCPIPGQIELSFRKRQLNYWLLRDETGLQTQFFPDTRDPGQSLGIIIHQGDLTSCLSQDHAVDTRNSRHAIQRSFQHILDFVMLFQIHQVIIEDETFIYQSQTFIVIGQVLFPDRLLRHSPPLQSANVTSMSSTLTTSPADDNDRRSPSSSYRPISRE